MSSHRRRIQTRNRRFGHVVWSPPDHNTESGRLRRKRWLIRTLRRADSASLRANPSLGHLFRAFLPGGLYEKAHLLPLPRLPRKPSNAATLRHLAKTGHGPHSVPADRGHLSPRSGARITFQIIDETHPVPERTP